MNDVKGIRLKLRRLMREGHARRSPVNQCQCVSRMRLAGLSRVSQNGSVVMEETCMKGNRCLQCACERRTESNAGTSAYKPDMQHPTPLSRVCEPATRSVRSRWLGRWSCGMQCGTSLVHELACETSMANHHAKTLKTLH